jgi:hypothetical protein
MMSTAVINERIKLKARAQTAVHARAAKQGDQARAKIAPGRSCRT